MPAVPPRYVALVLLVLACHTETAGVVEAALRREDIRWVSADTHHFRLHAPRGSVAEARLESAGVTAERARLELLELLGEPSYPHRVTLLLVPTRAAMDSLVGWPAGGWALPDEQAAILVTDASRAPPIRHELMHVVSWTLWGPPAGGIDGGAWISEGLATYATGGCREIGYHSLAAAYAASGELVSWDRLAVKFDVRSTASYVQAASIIGFVHARFGTGAVERLWREGLPGLAAATGSPAERLEVEWRDMLRQAPPAGGGAATLTARIRDEGCES